MQVNHGNQIAYVLGNRYNLLPAECNRDSHVQFYEPFDYVRRNILIYLLVYHR